MGFIKPWDSLHVADKIARLVKLQQPLLADFFML
jgi:hypothetical protein